MPPALRAQRQRCRVCVALWAASLFLVPWVTKARMGRGNMGFPRDKERCSSAHWCRTSAPRAPGPEVSSSESVPASRDHLAAVASAVKLRVILALLVLITNLSSLLSRNSSQFFCFHISYLMLAWPQLGGQMWHLHAHRVSSRVPTYRLPSLHVSISFARSENKFSAAFELSKRAVLFFFRCTVYRAMLWNLRVRGVVEARLL